MLLVSEVSVKGAGDFSLLRRQFQFVPKSGFVTSNVLQNSNTACDTQKGVISVLFLGDEECSVKN